MSFFKRSKRHNHDRSIFWISLAVLLVVIYIFFFAPVKKQAPLDSVELKQPLISQTAVPAPPAMSKPNPTAALPAFQAWMANSETSAPSPHTVTFFPNEKIYLHVTFPQLAAGIARVNVNWISPAGQQSNSAEYVIRQATSGAASIRFWLSLTPNGAVTEMLTGKEYKPQVYGQWQVQVFFNGEPLTTLPFLVQE